MSSEVSAVDAQQALSALAEQFSHWRQTRASRHAPIPAPLWAEAVALSRQLSDREVAKRCGLSQTDLRRRRLGQRAPARHRPAPPVSAPSAFVELTSAPRPIPPVAGETLVVEVERHDGARLRLHGAGAASLTAVLHSFLGAP